MSLTLNAKLCPAGAADGRYVARTRIQRQRKCENEGEVGRGHEGGGRGMPGRADGHVLRTERENIRPAASNFSNFVLQGSRVSEQGAHTSNPLSGGAMKGIKPSRPESAKERGGMSGASRSREPSGPSVRPWQRSPRVAASAPHAVLPGS